MIEELQALAAGGLMGRVLWDRRRDRLSFVYEEEWRSDPASYPLSLSMPLTAVEHGHKVVDAFLWGLLPDNDGILKCWSERFHVSPRHAFQLLTHVGEECAGAVQLVRPERAAKWREGSETGSVKWMEEGEIAERMQLLLKDHSVARTSADVGHLSLAGAQPKTGFIYDPKQKRWGVPSGMIPTTHIFKPATGNYDGYAENEHFCIGLARALGMPVASSTIRYFDGTAVIVVERYDRVRDRAKVMRIHQEDMCQALARMPHLKYQNQGGLPRGKSSGRFVSIPPAAGRMKCALWTRSSSTGSSVARMPTRKTIPFSSRRARSDSHRFTICPVRFHTRSKLRRGTSSLR